MKMLDGAARQVVFDAIPGRISSAFEKGSNETPGHFHFRSADGDQSGPVRFETVKAVYLNVDREPDSESSPRFFDSAPVASFLWVRATLIDGEIVEGMVQNNWLTFSSPLMALTLPSERVEPIQILIPHTSIAQFVVITTR
jgi:hypothetical protein